MPAVVRYFCDFRDKLTTDDGLLLKGPSLVIPAILRESYLQCLHEDHLSAKKVKSNAKQHMFCNTCSGQGWMQTSQTTQGDVRCASRGADLPESHCGLTMCQMVYGRSWAWISLTFKASLTFSFAIISLNSLSCTSAKLVGVA